MEITLERRLAGLDRRAAANPDDGQDPRQIEQERERVQQKLEAVKRILAKVEGARPGETDPAGRALVAAIREFQRLLERFLHVLHPAGEHTSNAFRKPL